MPITKKAQLKDDIDALALKHVTRHPNDKSAHTLARMNRRFGRKATNAAIERAGKVAELLDLQKPKIIKNGNKALRIKPSVEKKLQYSIIDDYGIFNPEMARAFLNVSSAAT